MSIENNSGGNFEQRTFNAIERSVILRTHTDIPEQMERERAIIIPGDGISDQEARGLPELSDYRIRYNKPQGELFISRFRDTGVRLDLPEGSGTLQLGFDKVKVVEGKWPRIPSVETALRYCDHIADSYDRTHGIQTTSILAVNRLIHDLSNELQAPSGERLSLGELEQRAMQVLVRAGYDRAISADKLYMAQEVLKAVGKDSMQRENPSRSRVILANIRPRLTKVLLANENKRNKYRYLGGVLYRERESERFALSQLSGQIKDLSTMGRRDHQRNLSESSVRKSAVGAISPVVMKVAPYVQVAAEARFLMNSRKTEEEVARLAGYVGYERALELFDLPSYYDLRSHERPQRLLEVAESIDQELEYADTKLPLQKAA